MGQTELDRTDATLDAVLPDLPPFRDLAPADRRRALALATVRRCAPDETIFSQQDEAGSFFLLIEGFVRLARITAEGDQVVLHHVVAGELFGIAMATESPAYSVAAKAATRSLMLVWPLEVWGRFLDESPGFRKITQRTLGKRMEEMQDRVVEMTTRSADERIALVLLRLVGLAGRKTKAGIEIDFPVTRQDISDLTGANMHSVSRFMSKWQKDGILDGKRRKVIVTKLDALRAHAQKKAA
ncbi:MAG: Crp/Fnr family transcriptional regulator [Pseudomonadota bacterium]